jgi:hypothetical protein
MQPGVNIENKNDIIKFEYIEMVRRGMEDNHLHYLLSNP